jgi:hypothetical protein
LNISSGPAEPMAMKVASMGLDEEKMDIRNKEKITNFVDNSFKKEIKRRNEKKTYVNQLDF